MAEFKYEATKEDGSIENAIITAASKEEAINILKDSGKTVLDISSPKDQTGKINKKKISILEKLVFFDHLEKMITAGLSLSDTLTVLTDDAQSPNFKKIIGDLKYEIETGNSLSKGMAKYENVFSPLAVKMIEIGETSGTLPENAALIRDQVQKAYELHKKVKGAMLYPTVIFSVMVIVSIGLIIFIFPQLGAMFKQSKETLPPPTQIMLGMSYVLTHYGAEVAVIVIALIFTFRRLLRLKKFKLYWNKISLRIPIFGLIIKKINITSFTRTLGNLIKSGIQINQAIKITGDTIENEAYKSAINELSKEVEKGGGIADTLDKYPFLFPKISVRMIAVGDKTGNTSEMLLSVAQFYQEQIDDTLANLSTIIEPIMLLVMGGGVLLIALSVIMPIYQMTGSINSTTGTTQSSG
ncbi:MAG: type II secretion system F family protein [Patescibacteria group bacterium]